MTPEPMTLEPITGKVLRIFPQGTSTGEVISGKYEDDKLRIVKAKGGCE